MGFKEYYWGNQNQKMIEKRCLVSYCEMNDGWEKRGIHTCGTIDKRVEYRTVDGNLESEDFEEGSRKRKISMPRGREKVFSNLFERGKSKRRREKYPNCRR